MRGSSRPTAAAWLKRGSPSTVLGHAIARAHADPIAWRTRALVEAVRGSGRAALRGQTARLAVIHTRAKQERGPARSSARPGSGQSSAGRRARRMTTNAAAATSSSVVAPPAYHQTGVVLSDVDVAAA
jgi:hypothetical protein